LPYTGRIVQALTGINQSDVQRITQVKTFREKPDLQLLAKCSATPNRRPLVAFRWCIRSKAERLRVSTYQSLVACVADFAPGGLTSNAPIGCRGRCRTTPAVTWAWTRRPGAGRNCPFWSPTA